MPYGTVKVDNITFDQGGADQNVTASGIYRAITSGVTVTGTISGAVLVGTTTVSGATVTGTIVQATTVQGVSGTFTSLTGTTTTGTTANFVSGVFTTRVSGATITGTTAQFTSGTFVSLTGTTITGTTISGTTISSTTGTFTSLTGTTITGTTVNGTTVNSITGNFTSLTGVTVTGTTASFASGVFTTQVSGATVTGTQSSFTSGNFVTLSGATVTFTSGVIASGTAAAPSLSILGNPDTGIFSSAANQTSIATNGVRQFTVDVGGSLLNAGLTSPPVIYSLAAGGGAFSNNGNINFADAGNPPFGPLFWSAVNSAAGAYELMFAKSKGNTTDSYAGQVVANDALGYINFLGSTSSVLRPCASIQSYAEASITSTSSPGRIVFGTATAGTIIVSEKLRIDSNGFATFTGAIGRGAPVTKTGNFTLAITENWIICNGAASITVTLPAASSWTGREVMLKTIAAFTVVSASSNIVPLAGGAAGTAILAATAGRYATLVSDGTNWIIMEAN